MTAIFIHNSKQRIDEQLLDIYWLVLRKTLYTYVDKVWVMISNQQIILARSYQVQADYIT